MKNKKLFIGIGVGVLLIAVVACLLLFNNNSKEYDKYKIHVFTKENCETCNKAIQDLNDNNTDSKYEVVVHKIEKEKELFDKVIKKINSKAETLIVIGNEYYEDFTYETEEIISKVNEKVASKEVIDIVQNIIENKEDDFKRVVQSTKEKIKEVTNKSDEEIFAEALQNMQDLKSYQYQKTHSWQIKNQKAISQEKLYKINLTDNMYSYDPGMFDNDASYYDLNKGYSYHDGYDNKYTYGDNLLESEKDINQEIDSIINYTKDKNNIKMIEKDNNTYKYQITNDEYKIYMYVKDSYIVKVEYLKDEYTYKTCAPFDSSLCENIKYLYDNTTYEYSNYNNTIVNIPKEVLNNSKYDPLYY